MPDIASSNLSDKTMSMNDHPDNGPATAPATGADGGYTDNVVDNSPKSGGTVNTAANPPSSVNSGKVGATAGNPTMGQPPVDPAMAPPADIVGTGFSNATKLAGSVSSLDTTDTSNIDAPGTYPAQLVTQDRPLPTPAGPTHYHGGIPGTPAVDPATAATAGTSPGSVGTAAAPSTSKAANATEGYNGTAKSENVTG